MSAEPRPLNDAQCAILRAMSDARRYADGWVTPQWIAEDCDHFFESIWASGRLSGLVKRGYVKPGARGYYRITDEGRAALTRATGVSS